jgi:hypothetical protein
VYCPNCNVKLSNNDQKNCEFCGFDLVNTENKIKEEQKVKFDSSRFKRRCC